jgi:uncharacterized RDD family membrane protein YckC
MFCSRCGAATPENAAFCANCGQPLGPVAPEAAGTTPVPAFAAPGMTVAAPPISPHAASVASTYPATVMPVVSPYAGFWLRLIAYIIDSVIILLGIGIFVVIGILIVGLGIFHNIDEEVTGAQNVLAATGILLILMLAFLAVAGVWLYYAWFESSPRQATLGKMALGLIVTDMQGRRVTFGRATGRFFAKIITGLVPLFIGYIMAGFTQRKQALHDIIASCLVLRRV